MTACPTCGCGVTGESIVARVEWGICAVPSDNSYPYRRLGNSVSWKKMDDATILVPKDPNTGRFEETVSPLQLQLSGGGNWISFLKPSAPLSPLIPDSVQFIWDSTIPSGYCSDPVSSLTYDTTYNWPSAGRASPYMYSAPQSTCTGTSWHFAYSDNAMRVNVPTTSGTSIVFYTYASSIGYPKINGWLSCSGTEYADRNYCNENPGTPTPITGACAGMTYSGSGWWFESTLFFYLKGTLTYYNV